MMNKKKIILAPQERIEAVEELAPRFFEVVLERDYFECLITDESDLADFTEIGEDHREQLEEMLRRLEDHYLIDPRPVDSTRIVDLLEHLRDRGVTG